jgi:hypothetical protein
MYSSNQTNNRAKIESNINRYYNIYWDGSVRGILDSYPNSAAAYSLRALSSTYTGPLIKVRRASDNLETDVYARYNGDLDTVALTSFCSGTNGFVTTWYDQSGKNNNAVQTTASNQPQIVASGNLITQGSKPSMRFDGLGDYFFTTQNNPFTFTGSVSLIHASYKNSNVYRSYETILSAGVTGVALNNALKSMGYSYANVGPASPIPTIVTDAWQPTGIQYNGTVTTNQRHLIGYYISNWSNHKINGLSNLRYNGVDVQTKTYGSGNLQSLNTNPMLIGVFDTILTTSYFGGDMQEILVYNSDQNSNRLGIENNINRYYNIY